jgi:hypothetical protein
MTYKLAEGARATKLLEELGAFYNEERLNPMATNQPLSEAQIELEKLLNAATPPSNTQAGGAQRFVLSLIGKLLPLPIRRKVVTFAVRIFTKFVPTSAWNLSWKPKS